MLEHFKLFMGTDKERERAIKYFKSIGFEYKRLEELVYTIEQEKLEAEKKKKKKNDDDNY